MKKIKDVFYDLNDIMVALIILALAALVIVTNIDSILGYPSAIAQEIKASEDDVPTTYAENPPITNDIGSDVEDQDATGSDTGDQNTDHNTSGEDASDQQDTDSDNPKEYSVYINPGSTGDQIADILVEVGLMKDRQEFNSAVAAAGAEGKLQAGNFIIPSDATPAEVISVLTQ